MVGLDEEGFPSQVPLEREHRVEYSVSFALESIPLCGWLGEALGSKSDGLMDYFPVDNSVLVQHRTDSELCCIGSDRPGQRVVWEVEGRGGLKLFLEELEVRLDVSNVPAVMSPEIFTSDIPESD